MFDFLFQGFFAFHQAVLILMALVCMGLGGVLLGYEIRWRLRAVRVTGTLIGVRERQPGMYNNVYRYGLPTGQACEGTSSTGSNGTKGRETGRSVELMVFADRPEEVNEAGTPVAVLLGAILFLAGLWPLHAALTQGPVTLFTWVMLVIGLVSITRRLRAWLLPPEQRKPLAEWRRARLEKARAELAAIPVRRMEDILASVELAERQRKDRKSYRFMLPLLVLAGVGCLAGAVHIGQGIAERNADGQRVTGRVIELHEDYDSDGPTYYPVVRFNAGAQTLEFRDRIGTSPPSHRVGDSVTVLYRRAAPASSAIIDRGAWNWLPPGILGLFGVLLLWVSLKLYRENVGLVGRYYG